MTITWEPTAGGHRQQLPLSDQATTPLEMALLDCLCTQAASTLFGPVCRCYLAWGTALPIQDGCYCACGLNEDHNGDAWIKLDAMDPDLDSGTGGSLVGWCPQGWNATITMGIYRCVPVAEGEEVLSAEEKTDTGLRLRSDKAALWRVLSCCPEALSEGVRVAGWVPIDETGGCAGSALTIQVPLSGIPGCPT